MKVLRSKRAGFCMGVALALNKLDDLVNKGGNVATFGPIIHNPFVLEEYAKKGVLCFKSVEEIEKSSVITSKKSEKKIDSENNYTLNLLLRAHGIPKNTEVFLQKLPHILLRDATCPKVKEAQNRINITTMADKQIRDENNLATSSLKNDDRAKTLLLYGDANHPEVDGLVSYACGKYFVSADTQVLFEYAKKRFENKTCDEENDKIVLAAQTTQDRPSFEQLKKKLKPYMEYIEVLDTICDATMQRQKEALELAKKVDAMVIIGGKESGNTKRLAELVFSQNIPTVFVECAEELQREFFTGIDVVGITAGASTPKRLVDKAEEVLLSW